MELKTYQLETLAVLRAFLEQSRMAGPRAAFEAIVNGEEQAKRLGAYKGKYTTLNNLDGVPYCCLRLPTGGGKTILAAHAIKVAQEAWIEKDFPVVLWLVPSNTIRTQTVDALKKPGHPYRAVLDEKFEGRVRIFDIADFEMVRPADLRDSLCVIVGTIQTLRVSNTEGRKVYSHHEALEPHYAGVPEKLEGLERQENGTIKFSFANLLHMHRPLMIVDEAHNAVTGLSRDVQERVNPCAVIEFTATPQLKSNVLHNVKAQDLKDEQMIKLPIVLDEHQTWQQAVSAAVQSRATLEEDAKGESRYIRPIVLFQAEAEGREVTVEVLRQHLMETENVHKDQIAVATGDQRELDGIDLFHMDEPAIRFIITKQALKEGWDCSFAYVFCSVANVASATDVEQLLGRVMRMPFATKRKSEKLNRAYAHVPATRFGEAASALKDKLVQNMGFEETVAEDSILSAQQAMFGGEGYFARSTKPKPKLDVVVPANDALINAASALEAEGISVAQTESGAVRILTQRPITAKAREIIDAAVAPAQRREIDEAAAVFEHECLKSLSPAELGQRFFVPALLAESQGEFIFVDPETLLDDFEWTLSSIPARLEAGEFDVQDDANSFEIDIDGARVKYRFADDQDMLPINAPVSDWTAERLAIFLDKQNHDPQLSQSDVLAWTSELVRYLTTQRGFSVSLLHRLKFLLSRKVKDKIEEARKLARSASYERLLFAPESRVDVDWKRGFEFRDGIFFGSPRYSGRYEFSKHFLGPDSVGAFDGKRNVHGEGDEFDCAQALDSLKQVKHWVRNVARHLNAFRLPRHEQDFYPDFVAELTDGRLLVVEYKGEMTVLAAAEHRAVGEKWEQAMDGKGLFMIVEKDVGGLDMRAQMLKKIGA
jgi:type III restriction enzyme